MKLIWRILYSALLLPILFVLVHLSALVSRKMRASLSGRRGLWQRAALQLKERDPSQPLIWFHVASGGELLQAEPVVHRFLQAGYQCAVTVTSVTGRQWGDSRRAATKGWVLLDYLPWDTRANARRMLKLLQPRAVVFVKYDLWPNLVWETESAGVPQFLVSGTLHPRSRRHTSSVARSLHGKLYGALSAIFAVSPGDRERFLAACPGHPAVSVTGDTRFDSVLERKRNVRPEPVPEYFQQRPAFILGSSWPGDEACVFPVLQAALAAFPDLVALVVPHEVDEPHLRAIEAALAGEAPVRLSRLDGGEAAHRPRVLLADSVGRLSALYAYGQVAFVGGGFGSGVHNVAEPLAMGLPTLFGPSHHNSPEALEFLERGFCFTVKTPEELEPLLFGLLRDLPATRQLGLAAAQTIEEKGGASETCFKLMVEALGSSGKGVRPSTVTKQ